MSRKPFSLLREARATPSLLLLVRELRRTLEDCATILDVGCGSRSPARFLRNARTVGLDGYQPDLDAARAAGTHDEFVFGYVEQAATLFSHRKFDACIALDVIEHLKKEDGWRMLDQLERLSSRRVVIFTPNGFVPQKSKDGDLQEHLSGWTADEMRSRGYEVLGMYGWKALRGEHHQVKGRPKAFWVLISMLTHWLYTRRHPEKSSAIYCVKDLTRALVRP